MTEKITFKGKEYPVRLSYRVFKGLKADFGKVDLSKMESLDPLLMESMLWWGLQAGHKTEGLEFPDHLKKEMMEDVLDDCFMEFMKIIPKFFPKAKVGNGVPNLENKEEKEKDQLVPAPPLNQKEETTMT